MRYMDLPVFVDVASIVAGYSMQTGITLGGTVSAPKAVQGDFLSASGQAIYTDRPTITYVPMTGEKFLRGLMNPIDPKSIFFMIQTGYPADFILGLCVESLNGVRNRSAIGGVLREADADFGQVLKLMREVQIAGGVGMRVEDDKARGATAVMFVRRDDMPPDIIEKANEVRRLLRLPLDQQRFILIQSPVRGGDGELAVGSRSMIQIMGALSSYIEVPEAHVRDHRASPSLVPSGEAAADGRVRIRSGKTRPADAFAAVYYREHWFWVDDVDWKTKRAFTAIMFFFTLADSGAPEKLPQITIPAQ
jgi:hypothetical protein